VQPTVRRAGRVDSWDAAVTSAARRAIPNRTRGAPIIAVSGRWRFVPNGFRPRSSEALMKAVLSAAMVLGLCGLANARDEKANPVGTWQCEYQIGGQKRTSTLALKKEGDTFVGTMSWPDQKGTKIKDPSSTP
jgi:hypothetical protein